MSPLNKSQRDNILRRLIFIESEINLLKDFEKITYKDYSEKPKDARTLERIIENIVNSVIDISKILLAGENILIPDTYIKAVEEIKRLNILKEQECLQLANFVKLRNILAHQYLDLKWGPIKEFIKGECLIIKFIKKIKEFTLSDT